MGVSERYEQDNYERWRKLPLRERYRWRVIFITLVLIVLLGVALLRPSRLGSTYRSQCGDGH